MNWQVELKRKCEKYQIESAINDDELVFICPKLPDKEVQEEFKNILPPGYKFKFHVGLRIATSEGLRILFEKSGASSAELEIKGRTILVTMSSNVSFLTEEDSPVWKIASGLLKQDEFVEAWKISVNDKVMCEGNKLVAKVMANQKHPERDASFNKDDILNLRISLETCQDVNDFINTI